MAERFTPRQAIDLSGFTYQIGLGPSGFLLPTEGPTLTAPNLMDPGTPDQDLDELTP